MSASDSATPRKNRFIGGVCSLHPPPLRGLAFRGRPQSQSPPFSTAPCGRRLRAAPLCGCSSWRTARYPPRPRSAPPRHPLHTISAPTQHSPQMAALHQFVTSVSRFWLLCRGCDRSPTPPLHPLTPLTWPLPRPPRRRRRRSRWSGARWPWWWRRAVRGWTPRRSRQRTPRPHLPQNRAESSGARRPPKGAESTPCVASRNTRRRGDRCGTRDGVLTCT